MMADTGFLKGLVEFDKDSLSEKQVWAAVDPSKHLSSCYVCCCNAAEHSAADCHSKLYGLLTVSTNTYCGRSYPELGKAVNQASVFVCAACLSCSKCPFPAVHIGQEGA